MRCRWSQSIPLFLGIAVLETVVLPVARVAQVVVVPAQAETFRNPRHIPLSVDPMRHAFGPYLEEQKSQQNLQVLLQINLCGLLPSATKL